MPENNGPGGHPMSKIAQRFETATDLFSRRQKKEPSAQPVTEPAVRTTDTSRQLPSQDSMTLNPLRLDPDQIEAPAFFVDRSLNIGWTSVGSDDDFLHALARELESSSDRNVFSLLLKPAVKDSLQEWQPFFSFVYVTLRRSTARNTFESGTDFIAEDHLPGDDSPADSQSGDHRFQVDSRFVGTALGAGSAPTRIFSLEFSEGTLFLLRRDRWIQEAAGTERPQASTSPMVDYDRKETICILSAVLNDSNRIADTMLADVFFKMMNRVWEESDDVAAALGGVRAGCNGARIQYLFKATAGRNPIFSAIWCATRMNRQMQMLQTKLKAEQGWADELCMNMGISHGESESSLKDTDNCMEFMIPGGALDQSARLAAIAGQGEVWITKNAISQLPKPLMDQVVLGIEREGEFIRNLFTRISDLPQTRVSETSHAEMGNLSATRIVKIEKPAPPEE